MSTVTPAPESSASIDIEPNVLVLEPAWKLLPEPGGDPTGAIEAIVAEFDLREQVASALQVALLRANEYALGLAPGSRRSFALVSDPQTARVDAVLSARLSRVAPDAYEEYLRGAESSADANPEVEVINRTLVELVLPAGRAIATHDFTLNRNEDGVPQPALERALIALFVTGSPALIEFSVAAQDLAVFDDMADYLLGVVSKFRTTEQVASGGATV